MKKRTLNKIFITEFITDLIAFSIVAFIIVLIGAVILNEQIDPRRPEMDINCTDKPDYFVLENYTDCPDNHIYCLNQTAWAFINCLNKLT